MTTYDTVLVTGGTGFLGRAVAAVLPGARCWGSAQLDLLDAAAVEQAFATVRPEVVVHLAARVGGITANLAQPADFLLDNLRIDANVCVAVRRHRPRHFIAVLSTCMYPDRLEDGRYPMAEALVEAGPPPPSNAAYATAKRALLHACLALHGQDQRPFSALIPANLYGPGDHFDSPHSHFLAAAVSRVCAAQAANRADVSFFGTGTAMRQYVLAADVAHLIGHLVEHGPVNAAVNVAPEGQLSIAALAQAVAQAAEYGGTVHFSGDGPDGQGRKDVSSARLRHLVPTWQRRETPLPEGLARTVAWYRQHGQARGAACAP